jgi:hypothetical protein
MVFQNYGFSDWMMRRFYFEHFSQVWLLILFVFYCWMRRLAAV